MDGLLMRSVEENVPLEMIYLAENHQVSQRKLLVKEVNDEYIAPIVCCENKCAPFKRENILSLMPEFRSKNRFLH